MTPLLLPHPLWSRRRFLGGLGVGSLALTAPGAFAAELLRTPRQTEGPFYPDKLPLDTDNDLLVINDKLTPAVGEIVMVHGLEGSGDSGYMVSLAWDMLHAGFIPEPGDAERKPFLDTLA